MLPDSFVFPVSRPSPFRGLLPLWFCLRPHPRGLVLLLHLTQEKDVVWWFHLVSLRLDENPATSVFTFPGIPRVCVLSIAQILLLSLDTVHRTSTPRARCVDSVVRPLRQQEESTSQGLLCCVFVDWYHIYFTTLISRSFYDES